MKQLAVFVSAFFLVCGFVSAVYAQDNAANEVQTAHAHAKMAQGADSLDMVHTHLHHVINCLVGPDGNGFDASAGNPCDGMGNGAIPDSQGNSALQKKLKSGLMHANAGLKSDDEAAAQHHAEQAAAALSDASS